MEKQAGRETERERQRETCVMEGPQAVMYSSQ